MHNDPYMLSGRCKQPTVIVIIKIYSTLGKGPYFSSIILLCMRVCAPHLMKHTCLNIRCPCMLVFSLRRLVTRSSCRFWALHNLLECIFGSPAGSFAWHNQLARFGALSSMFGTLSVSTTNFNVWGTELLHNQLQCLGH